MLIFGLCSISDNWLGWSIDSNPICHPSPTKKMKCLFLYYIQLLMISQAGRWTRTPSATSLQLKMKCSFLDYIQLLMISQAGQWTRTPSTIPLQSKNEMLISGLCSTSDDQQGWWMDSKPIHHPSPAKKMKCLFLDYSQFLVISQAGRWTRTPSTTPLQPKNEMLIFVLHSTSDDQPGWSMDSNPICHLSPVKEWNAHFWITFNFWWSAGLVNGLEPHPPPLSRQKIEMAIFGLHSTSDDWPGWSLDSNPIHLLSQTKKNEMLIFGLRLTSDDQPGWLMNLNPICHPSPAKKMKCSFLDYVQLLMIGQVGRWTQTSSATPLQPKKWNAHFWITFNFWWSARLVDGLKPHPQSLSSQRMKCSFLDYVQLLMTSWAGQWTRIPSATPLQTKKWYAHFCITFNFWWLAGLVKGLEPHLQALSNQQNEMLVLVLCSTSVVQLGWSMDSNPICHPSPTKKMKCLF